MIDARKDCSKSDDELPTVAEFDLSIESLQDLASIEQTQNGLSLTSKVHLTAGSHFSNITAYAPQAHRTWRTIQTSVSTHIDPRSALLYINHSCDPSLEIHIRPSATPQQQPADPNDQRQALNQDHPTEPVGHVGEVKVSATRPISPGDALTFFYPSTEWSFDRPFQCNCGAPPGVCIAVPQGACSLDRPTLERYFINEHIWRLVEEREQGNRTVET